MQWAIVIEEMILEPRVSQFYAVPSPLFFLQSVWFLWKNDLF